MRWTKIWFAIKIGHSGIIDSGLPSSQAKTQLLY